MKRWPLGFLLVLALSAHAESYWDGNAAVQRGDAEFEAGRYAVSNAFAPDTEIVIEDLASGKTITARVTGRLDEGLNFLVLLSPAAALPLGLEAGDILYVRVTISRAATDSTPILAEDTAPSGDPDRPLPAVEREAQTTAGAAASEAVEETTVAETAETSEADASIAEAPAETIETAAEEPAAETVASEPAEEPATSAEDTAFLAELAARSPQKQLFLPPREDEMFAYQEPVEPPAETAAVEVAEEPPAETAAVEVTEEQPAETAPAAVEVTETSAPQILSAAGPSEPAESSEPITLAEAQPPVPELVETLAATVPEPEAESALPFAEPAAVAAAAAAAPPAASAATAVQPAAPATTVAARPAVAEPAAAAVPSAAAPTVLDLPGTGAFTLYLQLAAYSNEALAKDTAARLSPTYPALVLAPAAGAKPLYRVFIGPLNRAESGTLLAYFRYRGFPDAFVRTAQK